jgi:hypothetical protein
MKPPRELEIIGRSSIFYFDESSAFFILTAPRPRRLAVVTAVHPSEQCRAASSSVPQEPIAQDDRTPTAVRLAAVVLIVLAGLFVFVHGCGQHDHDDELMLPPDGLPSATR